MKVGGRDFNMDKQSVEQIMRRAVPESIQKYLVEVNGTVYPPKQVLATVTGWERQSFTTMEAQRVLNKIGFVCRHAGVMPDGRAGWIQSTGDADSVDPQDARIAALEAAVATSQEAIAQLAGRIRKLERSR